MTGLFPQFEPPTPAPVPTTAPMFDVEPGPAPARQPTHPVPMAPDYRPAGDAALFETALELPGDATPGPLAFQFTVTESGTD